SSTRACLNNLNRPALIQEFKHIPFMRLVPGDFHGRDRAQIKPLDQRRFEQLLAKARVFCDRRYYQGRADLFEHFRFRHLNNARIRKQKLAISQWVRKRFAEDDGWAQESAAFEDGFARSVAV